MYTPYHTKYCCKPNKVRFYIVFSESNRVSSFLSKVEEFIFNSRMSNLLICKYLQDCEGARCYLNMAFFMPQKIVRNRNRLTTGRSDFIKSTRPIFYFAHAIFYNLIIHKDYGHEHATIIGCSAVFFGIEPSLFRFTLITQLMLLLPLT